MKRLSFRLVSLVLALVMALGAFGTTFAQGNTLNILYWQAVSILNPYLSGGTKDLEAASLILEPLAWFGPEGELVPALAADIPTLENGGISEDSTQITWTLKEGIVWSDGTPFTASDVVFTWEYCTNPETGCSGLSFYDGVTEVVAVDDLTVQVTFEAPQPYPYLPFVSYSAPILQEAQFAECTGAAAATCTDQNFGPIGTGPFMVETFLPNDVVEFVANPNFRGAAEGKPYFQRVVFKGGGDAESAARAVLETGEMDYAWNLQISPEILNSMEAAGMGQVIVGFAGSLERILLNQTNASSDLPEGVRSTNVDGSNPHPFLTNPVISHAMSMAIDRTIISEQLYGPGGQALCNVVSGPPRNVSPNNDDCLTQDIEGANAMLDEAGIVDSDGDGIREYEGTPLSVLYQTSTNAVRQSTQALIKQWWSEIGIETELRNIDSSVFFGGDPSSPDTYQKFYADVEMFTSGTNGPDAQSFLVRWICGEFPGPENGWLGRNVPRHCDPEYDALYEELTAESDPERRSELTIQLNDILIENGAIIPLIYRADVSAVSNTIEGIQMNGWDTELWNIEDWTRAE
ncbi:peptide ABC transporter substrate-binding protein [Phototrophicus methaneseepsis]|uniref:Peptide ABC transporter substrate-binding protein n=1 Tax=Phototrophicus methaneseepsis TaxID=2710758 RepID=A0A7S8E5B6_9CHLR|nr:peptide ABC transporter substrate-binding protein [Phototrophicus methaneseepsis]QPC80649.1 peptide ABC transporter substrate-binding protein [Phototrophicus methaneseepsis]